MDIENYLKPLTNNERAVLFAAAGLDSIHWIRRTSDLWDSLSKYARKRTKVPASQVNKAIESLEAKGYITINPKRGNYTFWNRRFMQWHPHNGHMTTNAAVYRLKMAGMATWIDWLEVADIFPVEDVKALVMAYRDQKDREEHEEHVRNGERVMLRQKEIEMRMLRLCEKYAVIYREDSPITDNPDEEYSRYMPYECDDIVDEIKRAAMELNRWTYTRRDIEREAEQSMAALVQK